MAEHLPLLVFPQARMVDPPVRERFPSSRLHVPDHARQTERLAEQIDQLQNEFSKYKASVSGGVAGLEPEMVLVVKIAGGVEDFKQAVDSTEELEWLGEWDIEDIEPNDDFYEIPKIGVDFFRKRIDGITRDQSKEIRNILLNREFIDNKGMIVANEFPEFSMPEHIMLRREDIIDVIERAKKEKKLEGQLFLSMSNERGLNRLLRLWKLWSEKKRLPRGKTKWRHVFDRITEIRRWGMEETLYETGMIDRWRDLSDPVNPEEEIHCQIELFYTSDENKRRRNQEAISRLLEEIGGGILGTNFIDIPEIAFHAVKVKLPAERILHLLETLESSDNEVDIELFIFPRIMYFRPTGQSLITLSDDDDAGETIDLPPGQPELPPIAAILDGVPSLQHEALVDRLLFDDPDNLSSKYQPGQRKHGTSMASLVVHGELASGQYRSSVHKVYHAAVMQPDPADRGRKEHIPDEVFFEDRIERAVRRMLEGEGATPAQAPGVKIINLSIGDSERPFFHIPSPWAKLLDWLSWKYRVLFCVSSGNFEGDFNVGVSDADFIAWTDEKKINHVLKCIESQLFQRRLLSPAESLNALTVGALHKDGSSSYVMGNRIDLLPSEQLFSPISRVGYGFRHSIKPDILFPGGRQLYSDTPIGGHYHLAKALQSPGQMVAYDNSQEGTASVYVHTRGTSNATALATHGGTKIYEVLAELQEERGEHIDEGLIAVLIKALLVHGAKQSEEAKSHLTEALKNSKNSRRFKKVVSRYMGYGEVDIEWVLACTEQRATVLGSDEIKENEVHEYRFPLPVGLSGSRVWRRMVVTLAWFSPINPMHRNLREAKLKLLPADDKWGNVPLEIQRKDLDHNQVLRGTVQHEVLEGKKEIKDFQDGDEIILQVHCKKDATERLDQAIPYGLAVTLEVAEEVNIPIYYQIREKLRPQVTIDAAGGTT